MDYPANSGGKNHMYKKLVRKRHNCIQCRTWTLIMHTGTWRYLHRTILATQRIKRENTTIP